MKLFSRTLIASLMMPLICGLSLTVVGQTNSANMRSGAGMVPESDIEAMELKLFKVSQSLLQDPQNPELLLQKGFYLSSLGRLQAAFDVFEALRQAYPHHPAPYANLASVYARWGRFEEARQMLLKSDAAQSNRVQTQLNLAAVNLELALAALNKASQLNPGDRSTQQKLKALERYLTETNSASFGQTGGVSPTAKSERGSKYIPTERLDSAANTKKGLGLAASREKTQDRLTLAAPDLDDIARSITPTTRTDKKTIALPASVDTRKQEVLQSVTAWAAAWSSRSYDDYIASYSVNFQPPGAVSRDVWAQRKKTTMEKSNRIQVDVKITNVTFSGATATVVLSQRYRSDKYSDSGRKELRWVHEGANWKIVEERTVR